MSMGSAMEISASGLTAQRRRLEVLISNLVNAHTTSAPGQEPYRRRDVVFEATPTDRSSGRSLEEAMVQARGVKISSVDVDSREPVKKYEPGHPHADPDGYVSYPNINPMEEMVNLMSATRSYEANLKAVSATKEMLEKAIEMLR